DARRSVTRKVGEKNGDQEGGYKEGGSKSAIEDAAHRGCQLPEQGGCGDWARALEEETSRRSDSSGGRRRFSRFDARQIVNVDAHPSQPAQRSREDQAGAGN